MTDRDNELKTAIDHLRELLENIDGVDSEARQLLSGALNDIHDKLGTDVADGGEGEAAAGHHESVIERLTESAKHFDDEHPTLAGMIGSVIDTLGRMGI